MNVEYKIMVPSEAANLVIEIQQRLDEAEKVIKMVNWYVGVDKNSKMLTTVYLEKYCKSTENIRNKDD